MIRIVPAFALGLLVIGMLGSCRKGGDDPWLSFRPRDKRITQTWEIKAMDGVQVSVESGVSESIRFEYNSGVITVIRTPGSSRNFGYGLTMELFENGRMQAIETVTDSVGTQFESLSNGYWNWLDDSKKRANIELDMPGLLADISHYDIPRLAGDELVLEAFATIDNTGPVIGEMLISWDVELAFDVAAAP